MVALVAVALDARVLNQTPPPVLFTDITASTGITFNHVSDPEKKYIVESMSGGVALVRLRQRRLARHLLRELADRGPACKPSGKTKSALYRNNGDGTFADVTDKAGVGDIGWGMGVAVGDYDNDGFDDLYVTCVGPNHLFRTTATARSPT